MDGDPIGRSEIRSVDVKGQLAVSLLDLEAAAARCERVYSDPEMRWRAFRLMLDGLRSGMLRTDALLEDEGLTESS